MAWGSKEFVAKSNAIGKDLAPAVAGINADGEPVLVAPSGEVITLTGGTAAETTANDAIETACSSGGVIYNKIVELIAAAAQQ